MTITKLTIDTNQHRSSKSTASYVRSVPAPWFEEHRKCSNCDLTLLSKPTLKTFKDDWYLESVCKDCSSKSISCPGCIKTFQDRKAMRNHWQEHHETKLKYCLLCYDDIEDNFYDHFLDHYRYYANKQE
jgi:hypothetical protein